ncbi:MAG: hypothetical protein ABI863_09935 [Ginsengibacter sp.]
MRIILLMAIVFSFVATKAQTILPFSPADYSQSAGFANNIHSHDSLSAHKWFFSTYRGISTGISFFNGGNATIFAAPMSVQLNRRLNDNFYAFANVSVTPTYTSFNRSFTTAGNNKNYGYSNSRLNGFGINPSVSLGLMYINEQKTFSISGSISAERSSYPLLPYYPAINSRQRNVIPSNR